MNPDEVFQKTAKGREEIEKRTLRIDHRRRTLLILVDGRSSAAELAAKAAHIADATTLLQALWTEGFVEPVGGAGAAAPTAAQAAPPSSGKSLEELKRIAAKTIERLMGPDGDALAIKIERAPNLDAFYAEAARAREALRSFLGPRQAEEFWKSLGG